METPVSHTCRYCKNSITPEMIFGHTIICGHCRSSFTLPTKTSVFIKGVVVAIAVLALGSIGYFVYQETRGLDSKFASMNEAEALTAVRECETDDCEIAGFRRLAEISPRESKYKANYAMRLTEAKRFDDAKGIYESILSSGDGTYDLMAYAARNAVGLGQDEEAVRWFESALSVNPRLVDVTHELGLVLVRLKQVNAALSLMRAFVHQYPESRGYLEGNIRSLLETQKENLNGESKSRSIRLYAPRGGHHFVPTKIGEKTEVFMVDSGASLLTMSTEFYNQSMRGRASKAKSAKFVLADGRVVSGTVFVIPDLMVGGFKIKDVEAAHCGSCASLLGRSVLKHFKTETRPSGQMEYMELTRAMEI